MGAGVEEGVGGGIEALVGGAADEAVIGRVEEWKTHLQNDHLPYRKDCKTCLQSAGKARYHRRIVSREALTLSIDLAGPFQKGIDQGPADKLGEARYFMAGTFTVPVTAEGRSLMKTEPEAEVEEDPEVVLEEEGEEDQEPANPDAPDEEQRWLEKVELDMSLSWSLWKIEGRVGLSEPYQGCWES